MDSQCNAIIQTNNFERATEDASFLGHRRFYKRKYSGSFFLLLEIGKLSLEYGSNVNGYKDVRFSREMGSVESKKVSKTFIFLIS